MLMEFLPTVFKLLLFLSVALEVLVPSSLEVQNVHIFLHSFSIINSILFNHYLLVFLGDGDVAAARFELSLHSLSEHLLGDGEGEVQRLTGDISLLDPQQRLVELLVQRLQVAQ
jgi:hypothetical protein